MRHLSPRMNFLTKLVADGLDDHVSTINNPKYWQMARNAEMSKVQKPPRTLEPGLQTL